MRRKRPRSSKVLFLSSIVIAVGATMVLRGHLVRLEERAAASGPGVPTVVAEVNLARGATVGGTDVSVHSIPAAHRPPGALDSEEAAIGGVLAADVVAGEPITAARFAGTGGPVAAMVPPGLRAIPIPAMVPAGLLMPGDRVDVLATFAAGQPHTETVVEGAEVLSILGPESGAFDGTTNLVLLVSPDLAERLAYARSFSDLSISVAPPGGEPLVTRPA
jgi:Flp pilus assembly protein CpaB